MFCLTSMKYLFCSVVIFFTSFSLSVCGIEFVVIVPSYNNERYVYRNLDSIVHQKLDFPFEVIYINDCSTDRTGEFVDIYIKKNELASSITVIHNEKRVGSLANLHRVIHQCSDHKVIVVVDGDDWFSQDKVLKRLASEYQDSNVWMTYGQYIYYPEGEIGVCAPIPHYVTESNSFRKYDWVTSHLKTFYAALFKCIRLDDLKYKGAFFPMANDVAMMLPMLEMASCGHIRFIPDVLYVYNHSNPLSNHNIDRSKQVQLAGVTVARKPYEPLDQLETISR